MQPPRGLRRKPSALGTNDTARLDWTSCLPGRRVGGGGPSGKNSKDRNLGDLARVEDWDVNKTADLR